MLQSPAACFYLLAALARSCLESPSRMSSKLSEDGVGLTFCIKGINAECINCLSFCFWFELRVTSSLIGSLDFKLVIQRTL
jgi:hypothetical protein